MSGFSEMDLVGQAIALARSSASISDDLEALLFPKSSIALSDRMLSNSRQYLHKLVADIETEICRIAMENGGLNSDALKAVTESDRSSSFPVLEKAGVFSSRDLLAHVFERAQRKELHARLLQKISQEELEQTLTRNLDHQDPAIAEAAMALLVAQNRTGTAGAADIDELSAEIFYELIWPAVAALETSCGYAGPALVNAAEQLLASHNESKSVESRALRLAGLLEQSDSDNAEFPHPLKDGLELCLAKLSCRSGLSVGQLIRFTAEPNMPRLVIALRALNIPAQEALSVFAAFDGSSGLLTAASYREIAIEEAQLLIRKWSANGAYQEALQRIADVQSDGR